MTSYGLMGDSLSFRANLLHLTSG